MEGRLAKQRSGSGKKTNVMQRLTTFTYDLNAPALQTFKLPAPAPAVDVVRLQARSQCTLRIIKVHCTSVCESIKKKHVNIVYASLACRRAPVKDPP